MKKIVLILCLITIGLTGCSGKDFDKFFKSDNSDDDIVGYSNKGAIDKSDMTELEFERIHYGAAVIQDEDKFLFSKITGYDFPNVITSEEDWSLLQEKLNIDMEDIDFDEYVVFGSFYYDLWEKTFCIPVLIKEMAYSEQTLYYGWRTADDRCFEAEDEKDKLCGFDLVKIKRSDFPLESRDVWGGSMKNEEQEDETTIFVESGGYYLVY